MAACPFYVGSVTALLQAGVMLFDPLQYSCSLMNMQVATTSHHGVELSVAQSSRWVPQ